MKPRTTMRAAAIIAALLLTTTPTALAQGRNGFATWPGSLVLESYSGTILLNESGLRPAWYLDTDADGVADYHLSFGPYWYEPASGAERPADGQEVTILAATWECSVPNTLMVFEIDGLAWRTAVEYTTDGYSTVLTWDSDPTRMTVEGTFMVDDSYFYPQYYLDVDDDGVPDFELEFGPHWYVPTSGAALPSDGDFVTITGGFREVEDGLDIIAVFEIDGETWRESGQPAPWAGGWVSAEAGVTSTVILGSDAGTWIEFGPGAFGALSPGRHFVEFWPVHPDWLPGELNRERNRMQQQNGDPDCDAACQQERERQREQEHNQQQNGDPGCNAACEQERERQREQEHNQQQNGLQDGEPTCDAVCERERERERQHFGGFHVDVFDEDGNRLRLRNAEQPDDPIQLRNRSRFQFRYDEQERVRRHLAGDGIGVRYWNRERQAWEDIPDVTVDADNHLVTFSSDMIYSHYAVYAAAMAYLSTGVVAGDELPRAAALDQNYPNPFNPVTVIPFTVPSTQRVVLKVYDALGAEVATLLDGTVPAGSHVVRFRAGTLPTGAYVYALRGEGWQESRLMMLVR